MRAKLGPIAAPSFQPKIDNLTLRWVAGPAELDGDDLRVLSQKHDQRFLWRHKILPVVRHGLGERCERVEHSLPVEHEDLRELFPVTPDPLDRDGHPAAVVSEYGAAAGSVRVSSVHTLVCRGVAIDLLYRDSVEWRVALDQDFHAIASGAVARVEGHVSGQRAVRRLRDAAARYLSDDCQVLYRIRRGRVAGLCGVQLVSAKRPVRGEGGKDRGSG